MSLEFVDAKPSSRGVHCGRWLVARAVRRSIRPDVTLDAFELADVFEPVRS